MEIFKQLLLQLILILCNAFFAATEIALLSVNEKKVKVLAEEGDKKAKKMLKILEEPTRFLSAIQIGITLAGFLGSAFAADNFAGMFSDFIIRTFSVPAARAGIIETVAVVVITLILSYFTLILGELVPKRLAMKYKDKLAGAVCGFMTGLTFILSPVIWFLTVSTNGVLRLFGISPHDKEEAVSEEDIVIMLDAGADEGTLDQDDIEYIKNVFKLDGITAAEVMTQRNAVVAVPEDIEEEKLMAILADEGYSRVPVYRDTLDNIIGIIHVREYLLHRTDKNFSLDQVMLTPTFVPDTIHLDLLLKKMQDEHIHMAVVLDEYGIACGIVTMEDIVEELLGEIWDEQDEVIEFFKELENGHTLVDGTVSVSDLYEHFDLRIETDIVSLGGLVAEELGKVPEVGDHVVYMGLDITVTATDAHRITAVEVYPVIGSTDSDAAIEEQETE